MSVIGMLASRAPMSWFQGKIWGKICGTLLTRLNNPLLFLDTDYPDEIEKNGPGAIES